VERLPRVKTFVVRITDRGPGELTGTVERVRTGERHRFHGSDALGSLIVRLVGLDTPATDEEGRDP
jgi:hypothetical protein